MFARYMILATTISASAFAEDSGGTLNPPEMGMDRANPGGGILRPRAGPDGRPRPDFRFRKPGRRP